MERNSKTGDAKMTTKKEIKVGDFVGFKYDVEQSGKVEKIKTDWTGEKTYLVRAKEGGYVTDQIRGELVELREEDLW
jgi:hypothetical protein